MKTNVMAVVGSTGKTGERVLSQLQARGYNTRGLSRNSEYAFDWNDQNSWKIALEGVETAYVTYFPDLALPKAEHDIRAFVDLSKTLGLKHIVLLSGRGEDGAQLAENILINSGLEWNIVRASWFMQNFSESVMLDGLKAGELVLPEPKANEPFIDVDDITDVAVAALTRADLRNQVLEITGPELLSFASCVQSIAEASQRHIRFQTASIDAYLAAAKAQGVPEDMAWLMNELFVHVLDGRNESTTNTVADVLGRPARNFKHYVEKMAATGVWNESL
ncbi:NAD(P)H-binding protein [Marinomonas algicola]|uniref:NAD(P)H-binding protein n=1 Tax=Marinomonas algicola TaxID=2773454 RepID=UPI00174CC692|nr:NAD(P)H-binding protein [Marinomonas algicola]